MLGVLAGVLSVLVTVLIGWQLYNILSFESRINKLKREIKIESIKQSEALKKEIDYKIDDVQAQLLYRQAIAEESLEQYHLCLQNLINAVDKATSNPYTSNEEIKIIETLLTDLIYKLKQENKELYLKNEVRESYISIIKKANIEHGNDILKFLFEANVIP